MSNFRGFDQNTCDFLYELQFCNTIEKQGENTIKYKKYITEPLNLLYLDLLDVIGSIQFRFETKPARCISTPYTDRRFSPTTPLKEYMYLRFRQAGKKTDMIGLYFDMGCGRYRYGLQIYKATGSGMNILREKISENKDVFSKLIDKLENKGFIVDGIEYKKDHYPNLKNCSAKKLLNMKSFHISKSIPIDETIFCDKLFYELKNSFFALKPFIELLAN